MKRSSTPRRAPLQPTFRLSPVAAGAAVMLVALGAQAQSTQGAADTQTITVTGIRRGIESAISVKKNADGVVEAISSEDIGKLPDTTIAESLARLPGLTAQRDRAGKGTNVSVRGLGPDFNGYLLNGREQTSTGDSRGVDLSVYPAELIGGATVYKTSDASLVAAGLAGTIDLKLVDPLAFGSRVFAANVSSTKNSVGLPVEGSGKRYSLSYVDQFADRKLGIALGFVHADDTRNTLNNGSWGNNSAVTLVGGASAGNINVPFGGGLSFEGNRFKDKRDGLAAILVFKPNKNFSSELDYYRAKIKTERKIDAVKGATFGGAIRNATVSGGVVQSGTFDMGPGALIAYAENIFDDDKIDSLGWRNTMNFGDGWSGTLDFSHNKAKRIEKDIEVYGGITTADTLSFTNGGASIPSFTLGNAGAYTNPATIAIRDQSGWSGVTYPSGPFAGQTVPQAGYSKGPTITDKADAVRLDFKRDLAGGGAFTDLQFGANFAKRTKDRAADEALIVSANNGGYDRIPYPAGSYVAANVGGTGLNLLTFDPQEGLWPGAVRLRKYNDDILSKSWQVEEKVTTLYGKVNLDTKASNLPVRGNLGVQVVNTDQSSSGFQALVGSNVTLNNPAVGFRSAGKKYTDFLPSLNMSVDVGPNSILRFGASQQIARSTLTDLRNSFAASVDTNAANATFGRFVGSAGNPQLKPFKAIALDISAEKYFGTKGYVAAALFYKKLDTYIVTATNRNFDFTSYAQSLGLTIPPAGPVGVFTTSVNGSGGDLTGIELAASVPFNLLVPALDGFGITASYSNTTSSVVLPNLIGQNPNQQVAAGGGTIPLPGLSRDNAKLMLYYERGGFSAFVADNYRSTYVGSVANSAIGGYPTLRFIQGSSWVSAQIGYEVQGGPLKGLGIRFEGNNMNKPEYVESDNEAGTQNRNVTKTGAYYTFKLSYKY
ncbi:MAG TPA: TonB-dependent receptor [Burkholderiaceae bacterium]|nr:TonB-dependent receptor [Burkholderiaceae bacterium]